MAYIGHSPFRDGRGLAHSLVNASLLARCGLVAVAAAAVVLALSGPGHSPMTVATTVVMAKGDRLAAPQTVRVADGGSYLQDLGAQVTTVSRGADTPLAADSPLLTGSK